MLLTGASGFLGSRILEYYGKREGSSDKMFAPSHREMDICNMDSLSRYMEKAEPDIVIHCAAISDTSWCMEHPEESWKINVEGTENLARLCGESGRKLIYCSSDQVYFGSKEEGAHRETEELFPANEYGRQKLEAERRCMFHCPESVGLRLSWMYDREKVLEREHGNFLLSLREALKEGQKITYPVYDYRGLTDVNLVVEKLEAVFALPGGIYNFGSENDCSTYETVYRLFLEKGYSISNLTKNETAFAEAPRNIRMDMGKAGKQGIVFPGTLERLLQIM